MRGNHTSVSRPVLDSPGEIALVAAMAAISIAMGGLWLTGQTAALVSGGGWPDVSPTETFGIAARLPDHWSNPKAAWPEPVRDDLPGPAAFYTTALHVAIALIGVVVAVIRVLNGLRQDRGLASRAQLAKTLSHKAALLKADRLRPGLDRKPTVHDVAVDLGRARGTGTRLAASIENSVLLLAAPRQGKTSQVIIPWLHHWPGPALVTSVRRDVVDNTYQLRKAVGPVAVMDFSDTTWPKPLRWSPVDGCDAFDVARQRADVMVTVGKSEVDDSTNAGFFGATATNLLAAWLHAAAITGRNLSDVLTWALDERDDTAIKLLRDNTQAAPGAAAMLDAIYRSPLETRSNLFTTVLTGVAALLSDKATEVFCPPAFGGIDIDAVLRESGTLYLLAPEAKAAELAPLISAFVDEITNRAKALADASASERLDPPLGMFLDEAANIVPLKNLPQLMSYAAGSGIFITTVLQEMAQARHRWGRDAADMLWGAATVKIALGGLAGSELDEFAKLAGTYRERLTTPQHGHGTSYTSVQLQDRKTLDAHEIRTLSEARREALIIHAATPPVITTMNRHYETRHAAGYADSVQHTRTLTGAGTANPTSAVHHRHTTGEPS